MKVCASVLQKLARAKETETLAGPQRLYLDKAMATLMQALGQQDVVYLAKKMAFELCSSEDVNFVSGLQGHYEYWYIGLLDDLLTDHSWPEVSRRTTAATTAVGVAAGRPFAALLALHTASEPFRCRLSTQDLVELLKMPTCFGEIRKVVLKHLGNRYGRRLANHWEFVRFAREQHLDLDFTIPPERPVRP